MKLHIRIPASYLTLALFTSCTGQDTTNHTRSTQVAKTSGWTQTSNPGMHALTSEVRSFLETPVSGSFDRATNLAEAMFAIGQGKEVDNLADLLNAEIGDGNSVSTADKFRSLLSALEITYGSAIDEASINRDKLVLAFLSRWLVPITETVESVGVSDAVQSYFAKRIAVLAEAPEEKSEQILKGYASLTTLIDSDEWLTTQFFRLFNRKHNLGDTPLFERVKSPVTSTLFTRVLQAAVDRPPIRGQFYSEALFANALSLLDFTSDSIEQAKDDRSASLKRASQALKLVDLLAVLFSSFDRIPIEASRADSISLETFNFLLTNRTTALRKLRDALYSITDRSVLDTQSLVPRSLLGQAYLGRARIRKALMSGNVPVFATSDLTNIYQNAVSHSEPVSSTNEVEAIGRIYLHSDLIRYALEVKSAISRATTRVIDKTETDVKLTSVFISLVRQAEALVYKGSTERASTRNCYSDGNSSSTKCRELRSLDLNRIDSSGTSIGADELKNQGDSVTLKLRGSLALPLGVLYASPKSTVTVIADQIAFHPLTVIQVPSGKVIIESAAIESAWVDVSGDDGITKHTGGTGGEAPSLTPLALSPNHAPSGCYMSPHYLIGNINTVTRFPVPPNLNGQHVCHISEHLLSPQSFADPANVLNPGKAPTEPLEQSKADDGGSITFVAPLRQPNTKSPLLFAAGGNGATGSTGLSSPLCTPSYAPFELAMVISKVMDPLWRTTYAQNLTYHLEFEVDRFASLRIDIPGGKGGNGGTGGSGGVVQVNGLGDSDLFELGAVFAGGGLPGAGGSPGCGPTPPGTSASGAAGAIGSLKNGDR